MPTLVIMIIVTIVITTMLLNFLQFIEQQENSIIIGVISGVISGVILGIFSWGIHAVTKTRPHIGISKKICHDYEDHNYRIKIRNNGLSNVKIVSTNFVISYNPKPKEQKSKNDIPIEGKEDPLLFGLLKAGERRELNLKTFDTFVLDAQLIKEQTIEKKTSDNIQTIYKNKERKLTIRDFFNEDKTAIISVVFEVRNFRTGANRIFSYTYHEDDILENTCFNSGRTFKTHIKEGNRDSDAN